MDLVTNVLGIQLDPCAPTVNWTSSQQTVLPFLPKVDRRRRVRNVLSKDATYVTNLAQLPESGPSSSLIVHLDKAMNRPSIFQAARGALSYGKAVVVRDYVDNHGFQFTLEGLEEEFNISPHRPVQAHGVPPLYTLPLLQLIHKL